MNSSLLTLSDAESFVGRFVDNGTCDQATIYARITEACRRLIVKADWPYTTQTVRIRTDNECFPLPRECEKIIWANVCGTHAHTWNMSYEFMASGPGEVKHRAVTSGIKDIIDAGMFPTMYDIPPIESFNTGVSTSGSWYRENFSRNAGTIDVDGDGDYVTITLENTPVAGGTTLFRDGVEKRLTLDYSVSGKVITLNTEASTGEDISVRYYSENSTGSGDLAESCTDRTLGEGYYLAAFSTELSDASDKTLKVRGTDRLHHDTRTISSGVAELGEEFGINRWQDGIEGTVAGPLRDLNLTALKYRQVLSWYKPETAGYISLYAVNPDNNYMWYLGKAHPFDTVPVWRRYKVANIDCNPDNNDCANILALCKMKVNDLRHADDILPIQNLDAIKNMIIAIKFENEYNLNAAVTFEQNAVRLLTEQKREHEVRGGTPIIVDMEKEIMGRAMHRRRI